MKSLIPVLAAVLFTALPSSAADVPPTQTAAAVAAPSLETQGYPLDVLQRENAVLRERVKLLEETPSLTCDSLSKKNIVKIREIACDLASQRQSMNDFAGYVTWMNANISGYSRYVQAGSVAASCAKFLPIPYAGQAGTFAKFVSHCALSLNDTSKAIAAYLATSQQFIARAQALDPAKASRKEVADLGRFADEQLLRDMEEVRRKLSGTADLSASSLSFLESLNHYVGSSDETLAKAKQLLTSSKDADKKEKGFLAENINSLKTRAEGFNGRLKLFDETSRRVAPQIKALGAYEELIRELEGKAQKKG